MAKHFIRMPVLAEEKAKTKMELYEVAGFPGILGCLDCTHIPIIAPADDEYSYVNRKGFHSINVQAICNANMEFTNVTARWPGGNHDSYILKNSSVGQHFDADGFGEGWLLGDSGYGLKKWLMTPFSNPSTLPEKKYNSSQKRTRCLIECAFGVLKSRWRILDHTGGRLCYTPAKAARITIACCVLHNICRRNGTPMPVDLPNIAQLVDFSETFDGPSSQTGEVRSNIVRSFM